MPDVHLEPCGADRAHVFQNLWPLYQHEVSAFETSLRVNRHGVFEEDPDCRTLVEGAAGLSAWWSEPGVLFPYLIEVDGRPAGFDLVARGSRMGPGFPFDWVASEFFVLHEHRGTGVAEAAALAGIRRHPGIWEVATWNANARALAFWRRTLPRLDVPVAEHDRPDHPWGPRITWTFELG